MEEPKANDGVKRAVGVGELLYVLPLDGTLEPVARDVLASDVEHGFREIGAGQVVALLRQMNSDSSTATRHIKHAVRLRDNREGAINEAHLGAVLAFLADLILLRVLLAVFDSAAIRDVLLGHGLDGFAEFDSCLQTATSQASRPRFVVRVFDCRKPASARQRCFWDLAVVQG
jgi:hypothetical protein